MLQMERKTCVKDDKEHDLLQKQSNASSPVYHEDFSDLDTGWAWVVLFSSFCSYCLLGCALYAAGIIHVTLLERYNESISLTSWAGALQAALILLAGPLSSVIAERFSCRTALVTSGILYAVGYFLTAFAPNMDVAILTCGLIAGTAGGIANIASIVVVSFYFKRRRNLAVGIALSGNGAGLFVFAPMMQFFKDYYGPTGFFIMLAGIYSHMIIFGVLCFPSKLEFYTKLQRQRQVLVTSKTKKSSNRCLAVKRYWNVVTNKGIFCYCMAMMNYCLSATLLYLYFPKFIVLKGFSQSQAAFFISMSGAFNVAGRILSGVIASFKHVNDIVLYFSTMAMVSIMSFIYPFIAQHYAGQVVYFVILGLFFGTCFVMLTSVSLRFVGVDAIATALGLEFAFGGVGAILGPVCAGLMIDNGGSYQQAIIAAAFCSLLGALFGGATLCFHPKETSTEIIIEEKSNLSEKQKLEEVL